MDNIEEIIEDSIQEAEVPELAPEPTPDPSLEATEAPTEPVEEPTEPDPASTEVPSPAAPKAPVDDFEKKFGIPPQSSSGRENRIPYSRVKKITEKAVADARKEWETGSAPKLQEYEAKLKEYEPKIKDYETRLTQVAEFERIMLEDKPRFVNMLLSIPGYQELFAGQATPSTQPTPEPVTDDMPLPDQSLPDGSKVYSMDGLKALLAWQSKQVEARVTKQMEDRYRPIEDDYRQYQKVQSVIPHVQKQIAEARTWPLFNENEAEITKALQDNPSFNLERAYQTVVWPKMQAQRDQIRQEVLAEIKKAPKSTAAPSTSVRVAPVPSTGPRKLEDVINDAIKGIK